jgi:hypothetical protein
MKEGRLLGVGVRAQHHALCKDLIVCPPVEGTLDAINFSFQGSPPKPGEPGALGAGSVRSLEYSHPLRIVETTEGRELR